MLQGNAMIFLEAIITYYINIDGYMYGYIEKDTRYLLCV